MSERPERYHAGPEPDAITPARLEAAGWVEQYDGSLYTRSPGNDGAGCKIEVIFAPKPHIELNFHNTSRGIYYPLPAIRTMSDLLALVRLLGPGPEGGESSQ